MRPLAILVIAGIVSSFSTGFMAAISVTLIGYLATGPIKGVFPILPTINLLLQPLASLVILCGKIMRDYELVVLLPVNDHAETVLSAVQKTVEQNDGKLVKTDKWGEKTLAYPIKKQSQALYFLLNILATPENTQGIDRTLRVNESLLRYLLVRKEDVGKVEESSGKVEENPPSPPTGGLARQRGVKTKKK